MPHPFDRYSALTNLQKLKEFSTMPLRKSLRVNTIKSSIEEFLRWAKDHNWQLESVPWCPEGFYIDREDRSVALGKDLLHLLGHTYMQEAASMLPVELLDPQPGETILDMSAAPGSKTTQIAAKMRGRGVIVANDVQEKRLWTLKNALYRLGVTNVIVTKKVGQWFAKQMTERFDRVLCDAPCTAQGTSRKDSDALKYCSLENIATMAKLQFELLESAIHACKVGGRVVYSTCTLTPEENEGLVLGILERFEGKVESVTDFGPRTADLGKAIGDSDVVQSALRPNAEVRSPMIRLWPQTYDTEGFFCAVLTKLAPTRDRIHQPSIRFQEELLPRSRIKEVGAQFEDRFGTSFLRDDEVLYQRSDQLLLATQEVSEFQLPVQNYSLGLPFAKRLKDGRVRLDHELATLRGSEAAMNVLDIDDAQLDQLLDGKDSTCPDTLNGDVLLKKEDLVVGIGLAKGGVLKNRLPRWVVQKS